VAPARPAPRPESHRLAAARESTPLTTGLLLAAVGVCLVVAMVVVLRSRRVQRMVGLDERRRRRFEIAVYCTMCLGTALVFLGVVVAVA
jgi:hypothetical protein